MAQPEIANWIAESIDNIVEIWTHAVRADESIKSDVDLSEGGLIDHVPVMLEEICTVLRTGAPIDCYHTKEARVHAYTRYRQGYRARDLIRETSLLRTTLLDHVSTNFFLHCSPANPLPYLNATRSINRYIDEELRYAVAIYTEEKSEWRMEENPAR